MQADLVDAQTQAQLEQRLARLPNEGEWEFDATKVHRVADHRLVEANAGDDEFNGIYTCADCGDSFLTLNGAGDSTTVGCPV